MIKFYTNRELSEKLGINLAKWKRWSRDLLPPDPLGGLRSGYARQYNPADAFTVYLGGHLIGDLKFTVPESKQILTDLHDWMVLSGFLFEPARSILNPDIHHLVRAYQIFVQPNAEATDGISGFHYFIRGIISIDPAEYSGFSVNQELYLETIVPEEQTSPPPHMGHCVKVLNISAIHTRFLASLDFE